MKCAEHAQGAPNLQVGAASRSQRIAYWPNAGSLFELSQSATTAETSPIDRGVHEPKEANRFPRKTAHNPAKARNGSNTPAKC